MPAYLGHSAPSSGRELCRTSSMPKLRLPFQSVRCAANVTTSPSTSTDVFSRDRRPVILFDGVCNLCNGGVRFALNMDNHARLRFAALQSDTGRALLQRCGRRMDDISSIVLVEDSRCSIKSDAILRIAQLLEQPFPVVAALLFPIVPGMLRDAFYDQVANNRYNIFGKSDVCSLVSNEDYSDRFLT